MVIFDYTDEDFFGRVLSVDTSEVIVEVLNLETLRKLQVNRLLAVQSSKPGQFLVGIVTRITRSISNKSSESSNGEINNEILDFIDLNEKTFIHTNLVRLSLIGTFIEYHLGISNYFIRTLETVPEIDANCFMIEGKRLTLFMHAISEVHKNNMLPLLSLGKYTLDNTAEALLNGNKFFQRHAMIVGNTGSGKSWTTTRILEQLANLPNPNALLFDIHGEYQKLEHKNIKHLKIGNSSDLNNENLLSNGILFLPYWLMEFDEMLALFLDRNDQNAPNQVAVLSRSILKSKKAYLEEHESDMHLRSLLDNLTVDTPCPYSFSYLLKDLHNKDEEKVPGEHGKTKQGEYHGKLTRLIYRLEAKRSDGRMSFMFGDGNKEINSFAWKDKLVSLLLGDNLIKSNSIAGIKVIDCSNIPYYVLPLVINFISMLVFEAQQKKPSSERHPIALFCDEAHLYMHHTPENTSLSFIALRNFERIAKEGRKYGVGLVVISQRPSEISKTILSQCNNIIAMRLTQSEDLALIKRMLPEHLMRYADTLSILAQGEALVLGDACILPTRIKVSPPSIPPDSNTISFWDKWCSFT